MAEYTPGSMGGGATRARGARHHEVLARWPVLGEPWARGIETRRLGGDPEPPPAARTGAQAADGGITPLEAINRAFGIPDEHGLDEIERRRGS